MCDIPKHSSQLLIHLFHDSKFLDHLLEFAFELSMLAIVATELLISSLVPKVAGEEPIGRLVQSPFPKEMSRLGSIA